MASLPPRLDTFGIFWYDMMLPNLHKRCPSQTSANKVKAVAIEPLALCLSQTRANAMMFFLQIVTTHVGHASDPLVNTLTANRLAHHKHVLKLPSTSAR